MIQQHQEVFPKYKKSIERVKQAIGHLKIQTTTNKIKNITYFSLHIVYRFYIFLIFVLLMYSFISSHKHFSLFILFIYFFVNVSLYSFLFYCSIICVNHYLLLYMGLNFCVWLYVNVCIASFYTVLISVAVVHAYSMASTWSHGLEYTEWAYA